MSFVFSNQIIILREITDLISYIDIRVYTEVKLENYTTKLTSYTSFIPESVHTYYTFPPL